MRADADILIRDYFNQTLEPDGLEAYFKAYDEDSEFRALADQMEAEIAGIRQTARLDLKNTFQQWESETQPKNSRFWMMGVAASVLVIIGSLVSLWPSVTNEELFVEYYEPYPNYEYAAVRDELPDELLLKHQAYNAYDQQNYEQAVDYFKLWLNEEPGDMASQFFMAVSLTELKNYAAAIQLFDQVSKAQIAYYSDAADWYTALLYLQLDDVAAAEKVLVKLATHKDYGKRANDLLSRL